MIFKTSTKSFNFNTTPKNVFMTLYPAYATTRVDFRSTKSKIGFDKCTLKMTTTQTKPLIPGSPPVAFFRQDQLYTDPILTTSHLHHTSPMPMLPPPPISATVAIPTHLPTMLSALTPPSYQHHDIQALIAATIQTEMTNQLQVALAPITTRLDQVEASAKTLREELQESLRSGNETNAQMRNFMQQMSLMMGAQQSDRSSPPSTGGQQNR
jgi:hypothetical protein